MSAPTPARLASAVRRPNPAPDLPAGKRWTTAADPESALLTLAARAVEDAEDFACEAYGTRVLPIRRGGR